MERIFNTGETNAQLREKYNQEGSILRKSQLRMLEMLLYIDQVCKQEHIAYSLDGGNVLGAVRHGGFVPWDDDVDIILERKEYNRLCAYLLKHPHPQFVLQSPETDSYYINHWNVLRDLKSEYIQTDQLHNLRKYKGLQIDLFPIETGVVPFLHRTVKTLHQWNENYLLGRCRWVSKGLFVIASKVFYPCIRGVSLLIGRKDAYYYGYGLPWSKLRFPKAVLFPYSTVKFEEHSFPAPANVPAYLTIQYGNYKDLPAINHRNHHMANYKIWE